MDDNVKTVTTLCVNIENYIVYCVLFDTIQLFSNISMGIGNLEKICTYVYCVLCRIEDDMNTLIWYNFNKQNLGI